MKRALLAAVLAVSLVLGVGSEAEASGVYQCSHPNQGIHYLTTSPTYGYLYHSIQRWQDGSTLWSLNIVYDWVYGVGYVRLYSVMKICGYVSV